MDEPSAVASRKADRGARTLSLEQHTHAVPVDTGARVGIEIDAAKRDKGRHRRVDIHRRGSIEREIQFLFVLVLRLEDTGTGAARCDRADHKKDDRERTRAANHAGRHHAQ